MRDAKNQMWAEACALLKQAEQLHRQFFEPSRNGACWEPPVDVFETERQVTIITVLPGVAPEQRAVAAERWLETSGGVDQVTLRASYAATVCQILEHADFKELFGENSLAEAPIAAALGDGRVIAGTVDRLLVEGERVRVVDFKTGAFVPASAAEVPGAHARQMAAYAEALRVIFPGRSVETALLYTAGPKMIALPG